MAEDIENLNDMASEAATNAAPIVPGAGLAPNDPEALRKIQEASKMRGLDIARGAIQGAALGGAAAQGQMNPLTAFVQGAAAGLQAPAQIWAQKQKQAQSVIDATPFGVVVPEAKNDPAMAALVGLPYGLVAPAIKKIAEESVNIYRSGETKEKELRLAQEIEQQNKLFDMKLKTKDPISIKDQISLAKDFEGLTAVKDYQIVKPAYEAVIGAQGAAGDKTMLVNFARMLNPTIRVNEGTMEAVDVSSIFDKKTAGLWAKVSRGEDLTNDERAIIRKEATRLYNLKEKDFTTTSHLWKEKAAEAGFDPRVIGGSFGKAEQKIDPATGEVVYVVKGTDGKYYEVGQ